MALAGTLRDFSLPDILQLISIQKKTGVLTLKSEKDVVTISFLNGDIVSADSLHKRVEDRLGNVLVKTGRISREDLGRALDLQKQSLQRLGHILVKENFMSKTDLQASLRQQVELIVYRLFRWRDGEYNFAAEEKIDYDADYFVPMGTDSILMDGVRMLDEWPMIERKITSFDLVFQQQGAMQVEVQDAERSGVLDLKGEKAAGIARLSPLEAKVFDLCNGIFTVQEIVDRSTASEFDTCKALFDLWNRDLIEESGAAKAEAERQAEEVREERLSRVRGALKMLSVLMFGYLALGAALSYLNPVNRWAFGLSPSARRIEQDRARLQRIETAVRAYAQLHRELPPGPYVLVEQGLLGLGDLKPADGGAEVSYALDKTDPAHPRYSLRFDPPPGAPADLLRIEGGLP